MWMSNDPLLCTDLDILKLNNVICSTLKFNEILYPTVAIWQQ